MTDVDSRSYQEFLESKRITANSTGFEIDRNQINPKLFDFQKDLVQWAIRKGRAAIFADTGLGKTFMQLEWARLTDKTTLIIAPLSVARQTITEGRKINVDVHYTRNGDDLKKINITNYEIVEKFNPSAFDAVILDESSILKGLAGKTRIKLTEMFSKTRFRLCCTATPAPNDITEIANHAEFLGIMTRIDMLSTFFVHDANGWRLKKHAEKPFYKWLASWGMSIKKPSDLGYPNNGYILPELKINPIFVHTSFKPNGALFWNRLKGITQRAEVRKGTMKERIQKTVDLVNESLEQWIIWCGLNKESAALSHLIKDSVEIRGSDLPEVKAERIEAFQDGKFRVLITKPKIAGFGMNFQNCHNMAFVGLSDSWESYYQCIRRCWRFGQDQTVNVYIILSDAESAIYENVMKKEAEATKMSENLIANVKEFEKTEIGKVSAGEFRYETEMVEGKNFKIMLGDCVERIKEIKDETIDLSVFSPPFLSLYTYSATERDIGNSRNEEEFFKHFGFVINGLLRITKPGRNCCVHVSQVPAMLVRDGYIGLKDFRGRTIQAFEEHGWIYHGEVCIDKDPQAQAIRTHSKGLLFVQLKKDASWLRPALADYILVFRKPGENQIPIKPDLTNDEWIEWARPVWYGIKESDTLNYREARENDDERHICPLQLGTIERCIRLWSNPGETIFSPFAGIGSEGYTSLRLNRKFMGIELKRSYFEVAVRNLQEIENYGQQLLFAEA